MCSSERSDSGLQMDSSPEPIDDDARCLLGTKTADKSWLSYVHPPSASMTTSRPSSSLSSSASSRGFSTSSGDDDDDDSSHQVPANEEDIQMTAEQLQYYTENFRRLQPNLDGKVCGHTAKRFLELSKLEPAKLAEIWLQADMDKDGQLTLNEFVLAMHLTVLAVSGINLGDTVNASSLNPYEMLPVPPDSPRPQLFTCRLNSRSALIAPRPVRLGFDKARAKFGTDGIGDLSQISAERLDLQLDDLHKRLNSCSASDYKEQAVLNSEIEGCLTQWQRLLRKLRDYRIELSVRLQDNRVVGPLS